MRQKRIWTVALALALALALMPPARPAWAATVTVNSTTDVSDGDTSSIANLIASPGADGVISLREAIAAANNTSGADTISFNISCGGGVCTIQPASALPSLTGGGTTINGYSQPGAAPGALLIQIDGTNAGSSSNDFTVTSANNIIMGLVINRFWSGVQIYGSGVTGNTVSGNHIGTDAAGAADLGSAGNGVRISDGAQNNTIGGNAAAGQGNLISGNSRSGVYIDGSGTMSNTVSGNIIGLNITGTAILSNTQSGVWIRDGAQNNTVGGDATAGRGNLISGHGWDGVCIDGSGTTGNVVSGNRIGTDAAGTADLGNALSGVSIGAQNNTIGGAAGEGNLISGNNGYGVYIGGDATGNVVSGNRIGTDAAGTADLGNALSGVYISSDVNNTVGGDTAGEGNLISGNDRYGVEISGSGATGNTVSGNRIGTNITGTAVLSNT